MLFPTLFLLLYILQPFLAYTTSPKYLSLARWITIKIHVKKMSRQMEGNIETYAGKGSKSARKRCGCKQSIELLSTA